MDSERTAFGRRLRRAVRRAGLPLHAPELAMRLAWQGGEAVSPRTVAAWLAGRALPRQANLVALASLLGVEPGALAFGPQVKRLRTVHDARDARDRDAIGRFLMLPEAQRRALGRVIESMAPVRARRIRRGNTE